MELDRRSGHRIPVPAQFGGLVSFAPVGLLGRLKVARDGVVENLSTEGLNAFVHGPLRKGNKLWVTFYAEGPLRGVRLSGRVVWAEKEAGGTRVGLRFLSVPAEATAVIGRWAYDHQVCEAGITFALKNICKTTCAYWSLCEKPIKIRPAA